MKWRRRFLGMLLCGTLVFSLFPQAAMADSARGDKVPERSGLCEHHRSHTDECGYTEGTPGTPCSHEHGENGGDAGAEDFQGDAADCYKKVTACIHEHGTECYPEDIGAANLASPSESEEEEPTACTHECSEESGCMEWVLNCRHEHGAGGEICGYSPAEPGTPCTYVCELCGLQEATPSSADLLLADYSGPAIVLGTDHLEGAQTSSLYFGNYPQSDAGGGKKDPVKWQILSNDGSGLFLFADVILDIKDYNEEADETPGRNIYWSECSLRGWLNDDFISAAFSENEQSAVAETELTTPIYDVSNGSSKEAESTGVETTHDKVFLLSVDDMSEDAYFQGDWEAGGIAPGKESFLPSYATDYVEKITGSEKNHYWLRDPGRSYETGKDHEEFFHFDSAAEVLFLNNLFSYGMQVNLVSEGHKYAGGVRPAFYIDTETVLFASSSEDGKSAADMDGRLTAVPDYDGNQWKLTLLDENRRFSIMENKAAGRPGETVALNYTGAAVGDGEYISAMIVEDDVPLYYGRAAQPTAEGGKVQIRIPADLAEGDYTLNVFSEQYNGEQMTDFASAFCAVDLTVSNDADAPALTAGSASRTSDADAEVRFTSSEAGSYYFAVVENGAGEPELDTDGTGTVCGTGEQTIALHNLTAGAKDIYIAVKDAMGNVSGSLKITIPALTAITKQPQSRTVKEGEAAAFNAAAAGSGALSYQWQVSTDGNVWTDIEGALSADYVIPETAISMNGYQYRCVVSSGGGSGTAVSHAAVLTVEKAAEPVTPGNTAHSGSGGSGGHKTAAIPSGGTWRLDQAGWWFEKAGGGYPADTWYECAWNNEKHWYHFNAAGYLDFGWFSDRDGNIYFLHDLHDGGFGRMYAGWHWIGGTCYYFNTVSGSGGLPYGALFRGRTTPDGYTVNDQGRWTVNGMVQEK